MAIPTASQIAETEQKIQGLDEVILQLKCRRVEVEQSRVQVKRDDALSRAIVGYLRFAYWLRTPGYRFELCTPAVVLIGTAIVTSVAFVAAHEVTNAVSSSAVVAALPALAYATAAAFTLIVPPTHRLIELLVAEVEHESELQLAKSMAAQELDALALELKRLGADGNALSRSIDHRRRLLLQQGWRSLRGGDWERYLAEVFLALGADVELTKASGDHGVYLVARCGDRRIAIQAKGYEGSVGNYAVQAAVAGKMMYDFSCGAAITNSRFTRQARKLAEANRCILIDETSFEDFAMGRRSL